MLAAAGLRFLALKPRFDCGKCLIGVNRYALPPTCLGSSYDFPERDELHDVGSAQSMRSGEDVRPLRRGEVAAIGKIYTINPGRIFNRYSRDQMCHVVNDRPQHTHAPH